MYVVKAVEFKSCREQMGLAGMIATGAVATSAVAVTALCVPFVTPAVRKICIPYVPATPKQLQNVGRALSACPTKVSPLVDLGSGDGRVRICTSSTLVILSNSLLQIQIAIDFCEKSIPCHS
uniref:Methyltransferase type 11 domain-containing protein n=1 Tax=Setaria digitata TaxID=48799 RepID=A0A915Q0C1_9BILA